MNNYESQANANAYEQYSKPSSDFFERQRQRAWIKQQAEIV